MMMLLLIEPEIQQQFHQLAVDTKRTESEVIHEALTSYLAADYHYLAVLRQRIAAADRSEFASEREVELFFADRGE